jgi:hypothetical protein
MFFNFKDFYNNKYGKLNMHDVIIFGDIHTDPGCFQIITKLLPELKSQGYNKLYMEASPGHINEIIKDINHDINHLEAFSDGHVPQKNQRTKKQENVLKTYRLYNNFPEEVIKQVEGKLEFLMGRLEWCKARKAMLEAAVNLGIQPICIDVENTQNYTYAGGTEKRTQHMLDEINKELKKSNNSKSIVTTGFAHVVDTWEVDETNGWKYNRGIIRLIAKNQDININHCFLTYSKDTEQKQRALKDMNLCASEIIQKIKVVDLENQLLPCKLQTLINMGISFTEKEDAAKVNKYRALIPPSLGELRANYFTALAEYIVYLGGKIIDVVHEDLFVEFEISSSILANKERLAKLGLERASLPITLDASQIKKLETKVLGITIETFSNKEILLTFVANNQEIINEFFSDIESHNQKIHPARLSSATSPFSILPEEKNEKEAMLTSNNSLAFHSPSFQKIEKSTLEEEKNNWAQFFNSKIVDPNQKKTSKTNHRVTAEFSPQEIDKIKKEFPGCKLQ